MMNFDTGCYRFPHKEDAVGKKKYDAEYISYVESGESAAVFITRDIVRVIDTTGKWIDILNLEGDKNKSGRWNFRYFTIELFPRKKKPEFLSNMDEEERAYTTWKTAHEDIGEQRSQGYRGKKYKICPRLVNRNEGKNIKKTKWDYDILSIKCV